MKNNTSAQGARVGWHLVAIGIAGLSATPAMAQESDGGIVREARPSKSVEDVLREEHTLFDNRFSIEPSINYSYSDRSKLALRGFLALDAIFLGELNLDGVETHITTFDLNMRYGFSNRLELGVTVPFVYRSTTYQSIGDDLSTERESEVNVDEAALGDISATLSYRLLPETSTRPDVVISAGVRAPTGKDPYGIGLREDDNTNLIVPTELPTGNGVWAATTSISLLKTLDPAIVFGSLGYTYNFEESFDDISASSGDQPGDVDLGDSIQVGFGTAFALNERLSLALSYSHEHIRKSEISSNGSTRKVIDSDANVGVFNIGGTYALNDSTSIVTNLGIGLTDDASDISLTFRMPFQL